MRLEDFFVMGAEGRLYARLTGDVLRIAQMHHGICSDPDCDQPIAGACAACGTRLCVGHLDAHQAFPCGTSRDILRIS